MVFKLLVDMMVAVYQLCVWYLRYWYRRDCLYISWCLGIWQWDDILQWKYWCYRYNKGMYFTKETD